MSDLLELAIAAHGGWDRWQKLEKVAAHVSIGGGIWHMKGWPDVFSDARVLIDPHRQRVEYASFGGRGGHSVFAPTETEIIDASGAVIELRSQPRQAFEGHGLTTRWDVHHLIYFSGYAMWTYLTTPFLLKLPGFRAEEIEPWTEDGETWRRLKAIFPPNIHSHSSEQTFYFDRSGILKRHDYSADVLGGTSSANYAMEPKAFGNFVFPSKRRVYAIGNDNLPLRDRLAVSIDFLEIDLE